MCSGGIYFYHNYAKSSVMISSFNYIVIFRFMWSKSLWSVYYFTFLLGRQCLRQKSHTSLTFVVLLQQVGGQAHAAAGDPGRVTA